MDECYFTVNQAKEVVRDYDHDPMTKYIKGTPHYKLACMEIIRLNEVVE